MRHIHNRHAILAGLLVVMLLGGSASGLVIILPSVDWTSAALSASDTLDEDSAEIDGHLVAYEYGDQIRVKNLATGTVRTIPDPGGTQIAPDVSGDRVVYSDSASGNWDIKVYQWSTNTSLVVRATTADEIWPRIDGNWVVWWDNTNDDVWGRNYDMGGSTAVQLTDGYNEVLYDVDNGRLAIVTLANHLYVRTLAPLGNWQSLHVFTDTVESLEMHGSRVALGTTDGTDYDVVICDIARGAMSNVATSDTLLEQQPSIFHNDVTWHESEDGVVGSDIGFGYPGLTFVQTPSFGALLFDWFPSIYGHRIAFQSESILGTRDVYLATSDTKLHSRSYGGNRFATAAAASAAYFSSADDVVLCNGMNFPDALSAAPLAKALDAPLLLTEASSVPPETMTEIARLDPDKIWIIGGTGVVSQAIYTQLDATYNVERVFGDDRFETSAAVARKHDEILGGTQVARAFFAYGMDYPDALAVGPVASAANGPVMLVQRDSVPASIADAIDDLDITIGYVIGGSSVVSDATNTQLRNLITANGAIGTITERWYGANRYETAAAVAGKGLAYRWIDLDTVGFATGMNFPDALGAGAALGHYGSPLLLTSSTALSPATAAFLEDHEYEIGRVNSFGGTSVVSATVYDAINAKIK